MIQSVLIQIMIVSGSAALEQRLRSLSVPDNVTLAIATCRLCEVVCTDVLIFDAASAPKEVVKVSGCLEYVLCDQPDQISSSLLDNPAWTAVWPQPLSERMLEFYLCQLLRSVQVKKELSVTKTFLDTLIDSVPDLIWFKDLRGAHMKVNDAFCRAVGKTKAQCEGRGHYYIWDLEPDEYAKGEYVCLETEEDVIRLNRTCLYDEKVKSKNGLRQFKTYKSPLADEHGEVFGTVGIAKDVTDLQNMGRELEIILSSLPFAAMIVDIDDSIVSVNPRFCEYFHVQAEQILQMHYSDVCRKILDTTPQQLEDKHMTELSYHHDGDQHIFHAQQQSIYDIFGKYFGIFLICLEVTKEYELQHKLRHSANTDFLTGLYNRRYFYEAVSQKIGSGQVSLIYFDLDFFKKVNDTYGHQSGDRALVLMANLLLEAFPEQLITRLGGDEFVVAFFGTHIPMELTQCVEEFIERAGAVFLSTQHMENLTVSAGIAFSDNVQDVDALLSWADKALYAAKAMGKARYTVYGEPV